MTDFTIKDSGQRAQFDSGMVRDVEEDKTDFSLILDGPMFTRWAEHLTKGARKYAARNWMQASGAEELGRFKRSALRHLLQWFEGEDDEDHAAAVFFNINGAEYTKGRMTADVEPEEFSVKVEMEKEPDKPWRIITKGGHAMRREPRFFSDVLTENWKPFNPDDFQVVDHADVGEQRAYFSDAQVGGWEPFDPDDFEVVDHADVELLWENEGGA